jgi:PEP-CTERM motif
MAKYLTLVGLMVLLAAGASQATPVLVTSPGALGANDSVNWSQLGSGGSTINPSFAATSAGGRAIAGSMASDGCVAVVLASSCEWSPGPGFNSGDSLIWALSSSGLGSGPLALSFAHVFGAGLWLQADAPGQFTAQVEVFNGATLLGTFLETSDASGDGIFIGARDTLSDITQVVFSLTSCGFGCDPGDFAVNSLLLRTTAATVPEPTSLSLLLLGAGGLALFRRSRRACRTGVTQEKTA